MPDDGTFLILPTTLLFFLCLFLFCWSLAGLAFAWYKYRDAQTLYDPDEDDDDNDEPCVSKSPKSPESVFDPRWN